MGYPHEQCYAISFLDGSIPIQLIKQCRFTSIVFFGIILQNADQS